MKKVISLALILAMLLAGFSAVTLAASAPPISYEPPYVIVAVSHWDDTNNCQLEAEFLAAPYGGNFVASAKSFPGYTIAGPAEVNLSNLTQYTTYTFHYTSIGPSYKYIEVNHWDDTNNKLIASENFTVPTGGGLTVYAKSFSGYTAKAPLSATLADLTQNTVYTFHYASLTPAYVYITVNHWDDATGRLIASESIPLPYNGSITLFADTFVGYAAKEPLSYTFLKLTQDASCNFHYTSEKPAYVSITVRFWDETNNRQIVSETFAVPYNGRITVYGKTLVGYVAQGPSEATFVDLTQDTIFTFRYTPV